MRRIMIGKNNKNKNRNNNSNNNSNSINSNNCNSSNYNNPYYDNNNYYHYYGDNNSNNSNNSNDNNNSNNNLLKRRTSYSFIITTIIFIVINNICSIVTFLDCYGYASSTTQTEEEFLSWIDDNSKIELDNKIKLLNFFKFIRIDAENNKASSLIHSLAGNPYHDKSLLSFLDTMPNNTPIKIQILSDLNRIADLAKVGNTREIVNLLTREYPNEEASIAKPLKIFPLDRKDTLIRFFKRMDNDITGNSLNHLFDVYEYVEANNLMMAYTTLEKITNSKGGKKLYSFESSLLNLEDFGAGYRSFNIWLNELNNLLGTFNLKDNKPRINELLGYVKEANVSYFQPKTNMLMGSFFYSSRTEEEMDGAILCNGQHININKYPNFVKKYLKTNKIASISIDEWNRRKQKDNNVGLFGYDNNENNDYFVAPYIPAGTFISNPTGHITVGTKQITPKQGDYVRDQMVQLTGEIGWHNGYQGKQEVGIAKGVFKPAISVRETYPKPEGVGGSFPRGFYFDLAASGQVTVGDRIMPRTVFQNLYVIISEEFLR